MAMIGKIRRMFYRQGKSVREIARATSLSRNTVRKWLKAPVGDEPKYRRSPQESKLKPFYEILTQALRVDAHRPKQAAHGQGTLRRAQGGRLRRRLYAADGFYPPVAG